MQNRQHAYLLDILRSAEAIEEYISGYTRDRFLEDARTQDAVLRRLLVIGEAAARLTPETRAEFDGLPFHKIVGMLRSANEPYGPGSVPFPGRMRLFLRRRRRVGEGPRE